jgi:hypothetical protein
VTLRNSYFPNGLPLLTPIPQDGPSELHIIPAFICNLVEARPP